jgi:heme exporter protein C
MILPRMSDSLHPGNGGNPGFNKYDLDSNMRMVFYPAVAGWILIAVWLFKLRERIEILQQKIRSNDSIFQ